MTSYDWRQALSTTIRKNRRDAESRYFQLATVTADQRPRNRSLVFRGFSDDGLCLLAVTDRRSDKCAELASSPRVEICWYFARTREQFRIAAEAAVHDSDNGDSALRAASWAALSDAARSQFFMAAPGQPLGGSTLPTTASAPPTFCLLVFEPCRIDHLTLSRPQHRRWISRRVGEAWEAIEVNP